MLMVHLAILSGVFMALSPFTSLSLATFGKGWGMSVIISMTFFPSICFLHAHSRFASLYSSADLFFPPTVACGTLLLGYCHVSG